MKIAPPRTVKAIQAKQEAKSSADAPKAIKAPNRPSRFVDQLAAHDAELKAAQTQAVDEPELEVDEDGVMRNVDLDSLPRIPLHRPALPKRP